jgi:hypothetical protein
MFDDNTIQSLGYYVYILTDGGDKVFYVGKGKGNRIIHHEQGAIKIESAVRGENPEEISEKNARILELRRSGQKIKPYIVRWRLDEAEAFTVEAALIDALNLVAEDGLTNTVKGRRSDEYGLTSTDDIIGKLNAKPIAPEHKLLLININKEYLKCNGDKDLLFKATSYCWRINKRNAERADYVLAVFRGIVKEVYQATK